MRPNLFQFATSELSQDAVLCWLAAWGGPGASEHDQLLHRLGQSFLSAAFAKHDRQMPSAINSIEPRRQYKNIDVLIIINGKIYLCIEDKVGTNEHSGQLQRYISGLKDEGVSEDCIVPVYIQTGEQSNYRAVRAAGYAIMRRREIIKLLGEYLEQGGFDSIVRDFHDHLADIETKVEAFRNRPLAEWDKDKNGYAWQGFYSELQHMIGDGDWGYVANPSGGFIGYWWHSRRDQESEQYLQLEQERLCFKISVENAIKDENLPERWWVRIQAAARDRNFAVTKSRFRRGQTMTVAFSDEYRVMNSQGFLDLDATVSVLRNAADVLDRACTS